MESGIEITRMGREGMSERRIKEREERTTEGRGRKGERKSSESRKKKEKNMISKVERGGEGRVIRVHQGTLLKRVRGL